MFMLKLNPKLLQESFPINKVEVFFDDLDHSNFLGCTWEMVSQGRVPIGIDKSDTDFNTIGKTGGEKTHKLTIDEMPTHDHNVTKNTNDNLVLMAQAQNKFGDAGTGTGSGWYWNRGVPKQGGNKSHNNLQPYIVMAFWRRIA